MPKPSDIRAGATRLRRELRARRRARLLVKLVHERLPAEFVVTGDHDAWPMVGTGLLSRMTTTMQMLFALQRHQRSADAGTLLRSLYEYLVHFAWLAADPVPARSRRGGAATCASATRPAPRPPPAASSSSRRQTCRRSKLRSRA